MYIPKPFEVTDKNEIFTFIEANSFGQLISNVNGKPFSTHLPFLISKDRKQILAHVARANPQHLGIEGQEVLITIEGPHEYVSPSWYSGAGVPTWNYQAVHIYGRAKVFDDPEKLKRMVNGLADKYESGFEKPWQPNYNDSLFKAIVGIDITVSEIQGKYKLSQNRPVDDQQQVIKQLEQQGSIALAKAMEKNL